MNESSTYQAVRIGDIADWRLICSVSSRGMSAYLRHISPTEPVVTLFDEKWAPDPDSLLSRIENTVYDHPQVLDDFSADVIVTAPRAIWVPSALVEDDEDEMERLYSQVYAGVDTGVMSEQADDATCLFMLAPGLNAFLQRTFPGARVHSHLAVLVSRFRERSADMPRVYIDIRDSEADFVAFDRRSLLMAATHPWHDPADLQYHLYNIMSVFGLDPSVTQVSLSGPREVKGDLMAKLRENIDYVMLTTMPGIGAKAGMPLAAALMLRQP